MKHIQLTQGKHTIVDDEDFEYLNRYKWHAKFCNGGWYAIYAFWHGGRSYEIRMHRVLTLAPVGVLVDHRNFDSLDNRKQNLRLCNHQQSQFHRRSSNNSKSKYKGVSWHKGGKKWQSAIKHNRKSYHIGTFGNEIDAAKAYDSKAKEVFGEFAYLNFGE